MSGFAGTGNLLKVAIRRDRVMVTGTLALLSIVVIASAGATRNLYPPGSHVPAGLVATMRNPAFVALYGPLPRSPSIDAIGISKVLLPAGLGLAILAQVIVRRHTRADEESGLAELIGAQSVGRQAALTAALALATGAVLAGAALVATGLWLVGSPLAGAGCLAASWVVIGVTGAGIAAICVQVAGSTRGAGQLSLSALGVLYLIRMVGDIVAPALTWMSPIGWATKAEPFGADNYWLLGPGLLVFALMVLLAYRLLDRRDLGAGLLRQRTGDARGRITGAAGLSWRLLRGGAAGWLVSFGLLGAVVGGLTGSLTDSADPAVQHLLRTLGGGRGTFIDLYLATEISITALIATAAGSTVAGHLAAEERARRLDPLLATPLSRRRLMAAYLSWAFGLPAVLMLLFTTAAWSIDRFTSAQLELAPLLRSSVATFPAMWTVVAVSLFLFGVRSASVTLSWGVLALAATAAQFGGLLSLPGWARVWSPFEHLTAYPAEHLNVTAIALMTAVAAVVSAAGLLAFRHRQLD